MKTSHSQTTRVRRISSTAASDQKKHDFSFYFLKWLIICSIAILLLGLITKPIRKVWAKNYMQCGDNYLLQKKYQSAILEYDKALFLFWKNDQAKGRIDLAKSASSNVLQLEDFYKEKGLDSQMGLIKTVKSLPENEDRATRLAKGMIEKGEFQYAIIFAKDATEMDRNYRDGWLYLGIANLNAARMTEISAEVKKAYEGEAEKALQKAKSMDPEYKPTQDYLNELHRLK